MSRTQHGRLRILSEAPMRPGGRYVLYWMQHSQRADDNPALDRAVALANQHGCPCLVAFVLNPSYPEANARHFGFLVEGLAETMTALRRRGFGTTVRVGDPPAEIIRLAQQATGVVMDRGYLRHLVGWRAAVAGAAGCAVEMVEGDVVVPVEAASDHADIAARTLRPKLLRQLDDWLELPPPVEPRVRPAGALTDPGPDLGDVANVIGRLAVDTSVEPVSSFRGGPSEALRRLDDFVAERLPRYGASRSDIVRRTVSELSPYLHLGQISPVRIVRHGRASDAPPEAKRALLDELVVRRELAVNFVHYTPDYDSIACIPGWARQTLEAHRTDPRPRIYDREQLEAAETDDPYWNAAMTEMRVTGYLHNHLRMYWGKQILRYTRSPREAYDITIALNNKYLLDGRDCNSYANVAWLFGLHDRAWPERDVFGKVRSMMPSGLKRKFDIDAYVAWANALSAERTDSDAPARTASRGRSRAM